jgi:hypothetical protein
MPILLVGTAWLGLVLLLLARVLRQFRNYAEASCGEAAPPAPVPPLALTNYPGPGRGCEHRVGFGITFGTDLPA